eukprot:1162070-Pelagomonas_calceolata.AAC.2
MHGHSARVSVKERKERKVYGGVRPRALRAGSLTSSLAGASPKFQCNLCRMLSPSSAGSEHHGSGTIDVSELKSVLVALNQSPSDEEVFVMISQPLPVSLIRELDARCRTASFA